MKKSNIDNLRVIYEDNHLLAVNKFPGDIVQGDQSGDKPLVEIVRDWIKLKYNKPGNVFCGLIHRIDRPVSGIVLFAKTSKALSRMDLLFKDRHVQKTYWAIVEKFPKKEKGTLINWLKKNHKNNKSSAYYQKIDGSKKATLHYQLVKKLDNYSLLEIHLETGRHHQIRVQLSAMGSNIKGDLKYGAKRSNKDASIGLHAHKVEFIHPVNKKTIKIIAPPPKNAIWNACL